MHSDVDYYKILQLHYLAESEVIESAYKRLAKKYHPDISKNRDSGRLMQKINRAYEVLGNPDKKRQYDLSYRDQLNKTYGNDDERKNVYRKNERLYSAAKFILDEYFRNIMESNFGYCYELISSIDKQNIPEKDFITWQSAVSKIIHLTEYDCRIYGIHRNKLFNGHNLGDAVEFIVNTVEYNAVMDIVENNNVTKFTVLEEGKWRVIIGHEKLQPYINKCKELSGILAAKSVLNEMIEVNNKVDNLTGLLNRRGVIERIKNEFQRFVRYGNVFSLIRCDIVFTKILNCNDEDDLKEHMVIFAGELLSKNLRKLDVVGRWGEKSFLVLLPETGQISANKVIRKIRRIMLAEKMLYKDKILNLSAKFGTVEYESAMEESPDRICSRIN
jgi:diguanylate cyclase (GGDEF)-like protein